MKYRKSHNDEWCKNPIADALKAGCNIIEVDLVWSWGEIQASHSWRPFPFLYKGTLEDLYLTCGRVHALSGYGVTLYFDFKCASAHLVYSLGLLLKKYNWKGKVLVGGENSATQDAAQYFIQKFGITGKELKLFDVEMYDDFAARNDIESVDVFGKKKWWMF